jgi:branched-subunit amino acid ABC-type transport system permease component
VFAIAVLLGVARLISKTRLGLFVRGVTQTAQCFHGREHARIDTLRLCALVPALRGWPAARSASQR